MSLIAGCDEAGIGALVGDVYAGCVILDPARPIEGLNDSKKLTDAQRRELYPVILERALFAVVVHRSAQEIDDTNVLIQNHACMRECLERAIKHLGHNDLLVIVDGSNVPNFSGLIPAIRVKAVPKADANYPEVMAASILAKVSRDNSMLELDRAYPQYGFAKHMGYPTKQHKEAIKQYGYIPEHRRSYNVSL
jgi:ribonuclease HII